MTSSSTNLHHPNIDDLDAMFDDHPSLASLSDVEPSSPTITRPPQRLQRPPFFQIPSHHSGFRSESSEPEPDEPEDSEGPWSPPGLPAWRKRGSGWYAGNVGGAASRLRGQMLGAGMAEGSVSRETSPAWESAREDDVYGAASVPLPSSPMKRSPEGSPEPEQGDSTLVKQEDEREHGQGGQRDWEDEGQRQSGNNYIRFAVRAEVQHRTEPFEAAFMYCRDKVDMVTKSRMSMFFWGLMGFMMVTSFRFLFSPLASGPVPDLVRVAGLSKSFEPLLHYTANGVQQVTDLQETGVAVWDLGESVRSSNMTSAPIIVRELDDLSESLKTLSVELTKFFANVDGDVDSILIVMEWARRELAHISPPPSSLSLAFNNLHTLLSKVGLLENPSNGSPTSLGNLVTSLFGQTHTQRTRATLSRTFNEFLGILEESINNELTYSTLIFSLFESIERQFGNLQRTVVREVDAQEREESELLSSLWSKLIGPRSHLLRKYEKNKNLLESLRRRTVDNKSEMVKHNQRLYEMKAALEKLRQKLVSPLVRGNASETVVVEEQIRGLEGVEAFLRGVRERQKERSLENLYRIGRRRVGVEFVGEEGVREIDRE